MSINNHSTCSIRERTVNDEHLSFYQDCTKTNWLILENKIAEINFILLYNMVVNICKLFKN